MKILHVVHDDKFIDSHIKRFEESSFENSFYYLKRYYSYKGKNDNILNFVKAGSKEETKLVKQINDYDLIVFYGLNYHLSKFVLRIRGSFKGKTIFHFYGAEIYNNSSFPIYSNLFSNRTEHYLNKMDTRKCLEGLFKSVRDFLRDGKSVGAIIKEAIFQIDYFAWYIEPEYNYIQSFLTKDEKENFPKFLYMPLMTREISVKGYVKKKKLMIGNSASILNNHADVFSILNNCKEFNDIIVPFSYGATKGYLEFLEKEAEKSFLKIDFVTKYVEFNKYILNFVETKTAIFGAQRQMALGNIILAIQYGVKVYLSDKSPVFLWLKNEGVFIASIEKDLEKDIKRSNLGLDDNLQKSNQISLQRLIDKSRNDEFLKNLIFVKDES